MCGPLSSLFRRTSNELGVELPADIDERIGKSVEYSLDDILDACTRLSYRQPTEQALRHMDSSIAADWATEWEKQIVEPKLKHSRRESSSGRYLQIGSLLND